MVRIVKDPEERKAEIMDAAWALFQSKSFEQTSVNEIIEKAGVAKGTFYYYFTSKDEILDAVVERSTSKQVETMAQTADLNYPNAIEKMKAVIIASRESHDENEEVIEYLHKTENFVMHQKTMIQSVKQMTPVFHRIILEGIEAGLFTTAYPLELTEFLMVGINFLFDSSIIPRQEGEFLSRIRMVEDVMETSLRAPQGSFVFLHEIL